LTEIEVKIGSIPRTELKFEEFICRGCRDWYN
jgi:hypothetical protein